MRNQRGALRCAAAASNAIAERRIVIDRRAYNQRQTLFCCGGFPS
jgi:hypothetical protein